MISSFTSNFTRAVFVNRLAKQIDLSSMAEKDKSSKMTLYIYITFWVVCFYIVFYLSAYELKNKIISNTSKQYWFLFMYHNDDQ